MIASIFLYLQMTHMAVAAFFLDTQLRNAILHTARLERPTLKGRWTSWGEHNIMPLECEAGLFIQKLRRTHLGTPNHTLYLTTQKPKPAGARYNRPVCDVILRCEIWCVRRIPMLPV